MTFRAYSFICLFLMLANPLWAKDKEDDKESSSEEDRKEALLGGGPHRHSFGVGVGQTFLSGKWSDHGIDKLTLDLYYTYMASYSFDFMVNAHSSKHVKNSTYVMARGLDFAIKARLYQFDAFAPFAFAGVGFYRPSEQRLVGDLGYKSSQQTTTFGVTLGGGAELVLNEHFIVGGILHYHDPFSVEQNEGPSVRGSYLKFLMTVMYTL